MLHQQGVQGSQNLGEKGGVKQVTPPHPVITPEAFGIIPIKLDFLFPYLPLIFAAWNSFHKTINPRPISQT